MLIILISIPLIYLFAAKNMRFFRVPSSSMEPTLRPEDHLLTTTNSKYSRGDIIVLKDPLEPGAYLVKRLVGLGGDEIVIRGGALYINGGYTSEPYLNEVIQYDMRPFSVPEDEVFVLGDNRNKSVDSHDWNANAAERSAATEPGSVPLDSIIGKVRFIYLPLNRRKAVKDYPILSLAGR